MQRLPADFAVTFAKALVTRIPAFGAKKPMIDWCIANASLMAMMNLLK